MNTTLLIEVNGKDQLVKLTIRRDDLQDTLATLLVTPDVAEVKAIY